MLLRPLLGFLMKPLDVLIELVLVHPPDAAAADLDRRKLARPDQRIDLRNRDAQVSGHVFERDEARLDVRSAFSLCRFAPCHDPKIASVGPGYLYLESFAAVCRAQRW